MFFSRLSWLSRPRRKASTDSAASRALHVTSDGTSTAPPYLGALRLANADGLPEVVGGPQAGPARQQRGGCGLEWLPGGMGVSARSGPSQGSCPGTPPGPPRAPKRPLFPGPFPAPRAADLWPAVAWFEILAPGRPEISLDWKTEKNSQDEIFHSLRHLASSHGRSGATNFVISSSCGSCKGPDACGVLTLVFADSLAAAR